MPELPEVETIKNTLSDDLIGKTIASAEFRLGKYSETIDKEDLIGRKILRLSRRGKYLLLHLSEGFCLIFHLRMTGRLLFDVEEAPGGEKYTRMVIGFTDGTGLKFHDVRTFGMAWLLPESELDTFPPLQKLGCEPLGDDFDAEYLKNKLQRRSGNIKSLLLDQTAVAGIGNIYADESLFRAGIHPLTQVSRLNDDELKKLCQAIREVLSEGIRNGGTTIRDYVDGSGVKGNFQNYLKVYGRTAQPCEKCGTPIKRIKISGRSTHFCPHCQKRPCGDALVIGITGGIGSGKSAAADYLHSLGAAVINADQIGHGLLLEGAGAYEPVKEHFGDAVLRPDGSIDRARLGSIVFADKNELKQLNRITHPLIINEIKSRADQWRRSVRKGNDHEIKNEQEKAGSRAERLLIIEAALADELKLSSICDEIWLIAADEDIKLRRLEEGRGLSEQQIRTRISSQKSEEELAALTDRIIINNGSISELQRRIDLVLQDLKI